MIALAHRYPTRLIDRWRLSDGRRVTMRPVLPQDAELEQSLVRSLSDEARYNRFFNPVRELSPELLSQMTQIDYQRHVAVVAESFDGGVERVIGEARYVVDDSGEDAEFALVVADDWRRLGIAGRLLHAIGRHACASGLRRLYGEVLASNAPMLSMLRRFGFQRRRHPADARLVHATLDLRAAHERKLARPPAAPRGALLPAL